jgi:hypothetical protein
MKHRRLRPNDLDTDAPSRPPDPSYIDVRDSWLDPSELKRPSLSSADTLPTMRPPAITLPDELLVADEPAVDLIFPEYEPATVPQRRPMGPWGDRPPAQRSALASLDEEALISELSKSPTDSRELRSDRIRPSQHPTRRSSRPPRRSTTSPPATTAAELDVSMLTVFEDLPEATRHMFLGSAREQRLGPSSSLSRFDAALVVHGAVRVGPERGGGPPVMFGPTNLVTARTSVVGASRPIITGAEPRTLALVWQRASVDRTVALCPWFDDALCEEGDRLQALLYLAKTQPRAAWREIAHLLKLTRFEFRLLPALATLHEPGVRVSSLVIVGMGEIELEDEGKVVGKVGPGGLVYAPQVLSRAAAPQVARASQNGAAVLIADTDVVAAALPNLPLIARQLRRGS